ncbi:hypothetical protein AB0K18_10390 [Nonomuraea sp. NPDC049421]|uniref:hypothetical protein n=1 Tax=Nonomuraea sp. NPDC049421 TaxID=3155275 RepID=UPI00344112CA
MTELPSMAGSFSNVPTARDIIAGVAQQLRLTTEQVERTLAEANIIVTSPVPADRRLRVLRLRATGVKHSGARFDLNRSFSAGVWAITHPANSAGKTSLLEFLVWPLRGAPRDLPLDVRSWLRTLRLDVLVAGKPTRITLDCDPELAPFVSGTILTADSLEHLLEADDDGLRVVTHAVGATEVEGAIGTYLLDALRMERTNVWQRTAGADGEGAPQLHGWSAYFGACYLNPGGEELLLGDVNAAGLPGQLLQLFVDIPYTSALTRLAVASKHDQKIARQQQRRAQTDLEARSQERREWEQQLAQVRQDIGALRAEATEDEVTVLLQRAEQSAAALRTSRASVERAGQAAEEARESRLRLQQAHLDAQETWKARQVLGRLNPTCCPRCEEPLPGERHKAERESAACAVCTRPLAPVDAETAEAILQQLQDDLDSAQEAERTTQTRLADATTQEESARARHERATAALHHALQQSQRQRRLLELELQAAGLEGRLAATGALPGTAGAGPASGADILQAVHDAMQTVVKEAATRLFPTLDAQIVELATRIGVQNLDSVKLDRAGRVNAVKAGVKTRFNQLSRGDRLRMRIATVIALLRVSASRGVASHPGLLLIDSLAAEEMTAEAARTLVAELQTIANELPDLQIIFTTAHPELVEGLLPDQQIITDEREHLF